MNNKYFKLFGVLIINFLFKIKFLKKIVLIILIKYFNFNFIDFGSKNGGSIKYASKLFNLNNGIGIDILKNFEFISFRNNFLGLKTSILDLPNVELFDAVIMSHFLEHISCRNIIEKMVTKSLDISKNIVFIQQPFFDENNYLLEHNLKFSYADWKGHPSLFTTFDFYILLKKLQLTKKFKFSIFYDYPIKSSDSNFIVNINEKFDTVLFDSEKSIKKNQIVFDRPIYKEIKILITKTGSDHSKYLKMIRAKNIRFKEIKA